MTVLRGGRGKKLLAAVVIANLVLAAPDPVIAQALRITHIDVDQGGATLFVAPSGKTLLVDTGKNGHGGRLKAAMNRAGVTQIDHLVITHYHEDHYGGADELTSAPNPATVVNVYDRGDKTFLPPSKLGEPTFTAYENALGNRARHLMRGETIALDPAMIVTCISSGSVVLGEEPVHHGPHENDMSVSLLIQFGNFRYFIGGDIEAHTESKIAARDLAMDVDLYEANHHGSHTSSSVDFLTDLMPTLVVISNGNVLKFKHPRQVTLNQLAALNPAPTILQTNKFLQGGEGGNVADEFIADLQPTGQDGDILVTVSASGAYVASYRGITRSFQAKSRTPATPPAVSIVSLLPNPAGEDRELEEVEVRNNSGAAINLAGWLLRDSAGSVWTLTSLGQLSAGSRATVRRAGMAMSLDNGGDKIELLSAIGTVVDSIIYAATAEGVRVSP
jgi:beta-lactamase superfamily II metal-dependent hydrolase